MKNVIKILKNKGAILEGIKNNIFKKKHVEKIAEERFKICLACEFLDTKGDKCVIKKSRPCCGSCGCGLSLKTRALNASCPEEKWDAILSDEETELLEEKLTNT